MMNVNECEDLLLKFCDALLIAAFNQVATENIFDFKEKNNDTDNEAFVKSLSAYIVNRFVLLEVPSTATPMLTLKCEYCETGFERMKELCEHLKEKHRDKPKIICRKSTQDFIFNYSVNSLALCCLVKNFIDASKHGDGSRIIRLYKYLLLYFKLNTKFKYGYQVLHLLAQIKILLPPSLSHELTWNRFANNKGKVDSNVELDRELEHRNKYVKADLSQYQGKITSKSNNRCSRSYSEIQTIINNFDEQVELEKPSGRHSKPSWVNDVKELAKQYTNQNLFCKIPGRSHSQFPSFPSNYLVTINIIELKKWMFEKLSKLKRRNIYSLKGITT